MRLEQKKKEQEPWQKLKDVHKLLLDVDAISLEMDELAGLMEPLVAEGRVQHQMLGDIPMFRSP